jgi:3-oxoadipate CoA-transferase alpha subunit
MPIDKRVASAAAAVADVEDGATVLIGGFGGAGFPNGLIRALRDRGARHLTLVVNSATHRYSLTHELIEAGQVAKIICSAARGAGKELSPFEQLWKAGKIELVCLPQGTFAEAIRAGGAGIPAFYTPVGVGTDLTRGKEVRVFHGREHVLEEAIMGDVALIRADTADTYGNLTFRYAQANFGPAMATAARRTIAEVRAVEDTPIPHTRAQLPGIYIDRVVVEEKTP